MVTITLSTPGGGRQARHYPDAEAAVVALALTLTPEAVGRLRLDLHRVQLRLMGVPVTLPAADAPADPGAA